MHSLAPLVVGYEHRWHLGHFIADERLGPVGDWVVGVENVEETGTSRKSEVLPEIFDSSHGDEHSCIRFPLNISTLKSNSGIFQKKIRTHLWAIRRRKMP